MGHLHQMQWSEDVLVYVHMAQAFWVYCSVPKVIILTLTPSCSTTAISIVLVWF